MRLLHNTPVDITNEHMGSQSVLFEGSVAHGPRKALVRTKFVHMGLSIDPHEQNQLIKHTILV
jgi:hypothetical protein